MFMKLKDIKKELHKKLYKKLKNDIKKLRPAQEKAVKAGLLKRKNMLVCTPTASGKTLIAEIAAMQGIYNDMGKTVYIVPLKALASEKFNTFRKKYPDINVGISIGDIDSSEKGLGKNDFIIATSEKLDSLLRHRVSWVRDISTVVIDEIHLMNDAHRGPTLEILITMLKSILQNAQFIGLSATIGNPHELSEWLDAELVIDDWRPVELRQGIFSNGKVKFIDYSNFR
ncbi:DEAD/DEAH box helicase [Candidatus Woesearchaeota archaeon]|nr:DEAD/DEAH box helicase [Candidatus Woesearchaeota archaeon]